MLSYYGACDWLGWVLLNNQSVSPNHHRRCLLTEDFKVRLPALLYSLWMEIDCRAVSLGALRVKRAVASN